MEYDLKIGDRVRITSNYPHRVCGIRTISFWDKASDTFKVEELPNDNCTISFYNFKLLNRNNTGFGQSINQPEKTMNKLEQFALAFKKEPERTFRKLGITNGDDILTDDGVKIFLTWLLGKNSADFKKEVCDEMLKEVEEKK